jgi:hypothetical protein
MTKAGDYHTKITAPGFVPATVGLTADDVTQFSAKYTAAQAAFSGRSAATDTKKSKTGDFSGPGAAFDQLVEEFRNHGNKIRISDASDATCLDFGVDRRSATHTRRKAPAEAPVFSLDSVVLGGFTVTFRTANSASPRARAENANGVQIAIVDASHPVADNEADDAPSVLKSRSPAYLDSSRMPGQVRLYARWITQRGEGSPWSVPLSVTVM